MKKINLSITIICSAIVANIGLLLISDSASATNNATFTAFPPSSVETAEPIVMLTMSRDHQYFFEAYSDFSDLDPENNNGIDSTYSNLVNYYGYFQSNVCYDYVAASDRFEPKARQSTPYYCDGVGGKWSGNFLNWATMTRMDVDVKFFTAVSVLSILLQKQYLNVLSYHPTLMHSQSIIMVMISRG